MPIAPAGGGHLPDHPREASQVLAKTQDNEEIITRVAALDIGKAELVCCVRVPEEDHRGRRLQEVETYSAMTRPLLSMADRLTLYRSKTNRVPSDLVFMRSATPPGSTR
jgi:hypothetical protein